MMPDIPEEKSFTVLRMFFLSFLTLRDVRYCFPGFQSLVKTQVHGHAFSVDPWFIQRSKREFCHRSNNMYCPQRWGGLTLRNRLFLNSVSDGSLNMFMPVLGIILAVIVTVAV